MNASVVWLASAVLVMIAGRVRAENEGDRAPPATEIVLASGDEGVGRAAAQHLAVQLGRQSRVVTSTETGDLPGLMRRRTAELVIVLDTARSQVSVLVPREGTILSRAIDESLSREAPYAIALTALELVELAREVQEGTVVTEGRRPRDRGRAREGEAEAALEPGGGLRFALALDASACVTSSPGHEATLAQPMIGAHLRLRFGGSAWFAALGARARFFGGRDLDLGAAGRATFERTEGFVRLAAGRHQSWGEVTLGLAVGLAQTRVSARREDGALALDVRNREWIGAGLELMIPVVGGLGIGAGGELIVTPRTINYRVRDAVLEGGALRMSAFVGLVFELG